MEFSTRELFVRVVLAIGFFALMLVAIAVTCDRGFGATLSSASPQMTQIDSAESQQRKSDR